MPFFPTGITTGGPYQPLNTNLTQISSITPGVNGLMQYKSGSWASRTLTQVWADFMADPGVGGYAYTALPFTITDNKRLLGRDSALPPFSAQEIEIGSGLDLTSGVLSVDTSTGFVTSVTGTANEITAFPTSGAVVVSLPSALTFTGKTVTGGTFNSGAFNGTVGATTPSTGAFTTLSASAGISVTGGAFAPGSMYQNGDHGLVLAGTAGMINDLGLTNAGGTLVATIPAGTGTLAVLGPLDAQSGLTVTGRVEILSPAGGSYIESSGTASTNHLIFVNGNGTVGTITTSGSATSFNTSSDGRLKTNIRDFKLSAQIIDAIKPRIFDWKTGEKDTVGFVAQELYAIYPAAVTKGDDDPDKIEQQWAVDYSKLVPVLVAEIQSLRARVEKLENGKAVTEGAADSGGTGFRVLRVPN